MLSKLYFSVSKFESIFFYKIWNLNCIYLKISDRVFPRSWSTLLNRLYTFYSWGDRALQPAGHEYGFGCERAFVGFFLPKNAVRKGPLYLGTGLTVRCFFVLATGAMSWPSTFVYRFLMWLLHRSRRTSFVRFPFVFSLVSRDFPCFLSAFLRGWYCLHNAMSS